MSEDTRRSRILLFSLIGVVVAVVVIALIAVFTRGGGAQLDPDTPEGVVQGYTRAVIDGDVNAAIAFLAPEIAGSCSRIPLPPEDRRVTLLRTTERDGTARVEVVIATVYGGGPLGANEYESEGVFDLVEVAGTWYVQRTPWDLAVCSESGL